MEYFEYNPYDWYWVKTSGVVYSSARNTEVSTKDKTYLAWVKRGGIADPYPTDNSGIESRALLIRMLSSYPGLGINNIGDYEQRAEDLYKIKFSKKEFLLWCGLENITKLNAAINAGNMTAKTVHDLLFAADYIDVSDSDLVKMVQLLTTTEAGSVLTLDDANRILQGAKYEGSS